MSDLLPCPHCGGEALILNKPPYDCSVTRLFWIECSNCSSKTRETYDSRLVISTWNTRNTTEQAGVQGDIDSIALDLMQKVWTIGNRHGPDSQRKAQIQICLADFIKSFKAQPTSEAQDYNARMLEGYAESYDTMAKMGDGKVSCTSVAVDIRQNMIKQLKAQPAGSAVAEPVDMILYCPNCGKQHIDAPESIPHLNENKPAHDYFNPWTNPPHRSHLCHECGCIWRPADVPTNGVAEIRTEGKADIWPVNAEEITASHANTSPAAQEGYVMVPIEPTEEMISRGSDAYLECSVVSVYKAMIAATQQRKE